MAGCPRTGSRVSAKTVIPSTARQGKHLGFHGKMIFPPVTSMAGQQDKNIKKLHPDRKLWAKIAK
jgi:hypothetical protein